MVSIIFSTSFKYSFLSFFILSLFFIYFSLFLFDLSSIFSPFLFSLSLSLSLQRLPLLSLDWTKTFVYSLLPLGSLRSLIGFMVVGQCEFVLFLFFSISNQSPLHRRIFVASTLDLFHQAPMTMKMVMIPKMLICHHKILQVLTEWLVVVT